MRAQIRLLPDGRRLHMQDGPIDLIVEAFGEPRKLKEAYEAASRRFVSVLDELCSELPILRAQVRSGCRVPLGPVAKRMFAAVLPYAERTFITPMAAVAGAVAEEILGAMTQAAKLSRAYVNDGGDIAIHLEPGERFVIGMVERPDRPSLFGTATLDWPKDVRGIATSGWRGRSFSLGIADAVTVLAPRAAMADAAATIIGNAVDLPGHPNVVRVPACTVDPDSDLRERLVTQEVGALADEDVERALAEGVAVAERLRVERLIDAAALSLAGRTRVLGSVVPTGIGRVLDLHRAYALG